MVTKQEFLTYMVKHHGEGDYEWLYKHLRKLVRVTGEMELRQMRKIVYYSQDERLMYRNKLAVLGTEYTPDQLNQYISTIEYALLHIGETK